MLTPTLQVWGISATEDVSLGPDDKATSQSRLRLHSRITIFDQDGSFDIIRIRLQGAVRTQIGSQVAVEKFPSSTQTKTNLDFQPVHSASRQRSDEQHLDFICSVPATNTKRSERKSSSGDVLDSFVPTMSVTGNTYVTRVSALRDRHLVEGSCKVAYWLEVEFWRSESNHLVGALTCPVDVSALLMPLDVEVSIPNQSNEIEQVVKPPLRSLGRLIWSHPQPELSVTIPKKLGYLLSDSSRLSRGSRHLSIPVSVHIKRPSQSRRPVQALPPGDSLKCSVKAMWYTRRTFTTGSSAAESVVNNTTVSAQKLSLTLPPLYRLDSESSPCTTSMELNLILPGSISSPSVHTDLLAVSYILDLSMRFEFNGHEILKGSYNASLRLPLTLRAAQPHPIISRRNFDPLVGYVAEEAIYAPPPYVF
ncbi:uncharacterized protein Z518_01540 [Rhinocladiella mackenziei CBS 650.93]|uniref:Arrestin-like N-terminal domain-containing protein n=1 Tax=Rhinocladiella mackenziei CBS 650.93 TaxID=1442369 RepID=A0A0D2G684_9EURO|nr:uncharacterized protein Z518_01540 [Rhinocladiella mackenziei CBS 650.93]KIX10457.1 hypothetical protein Z518_01540 [Rhinocladiella mackenziei CBS 650.93]